MIEETGEDKTVQYVSSWFVVVFFSFIDDCNWAEVPNRTRNDRNQLVLDMQMHLVGHSMNQHHNYIDLLDLEKFALD
jgi:hypothetical protein